MSGDFQKERGSRGIDRVQLVLVAPTIYVLSNPTYRCERPDSGFEPLSRALEVPSLPSRFCDQPASPQPFDHVTPTNKHRCRRSGSVLGAGSIAKSDEGFGLGKRNPRALVRPLTDNTARFVQKLERLVGPVD